MTNGRNVHQRSLVLDVEEHMLTYSFYIAT